MSLENVKECLREILIAEYTDDFVDHLARPMARPGILAPRPLDPGETVGITLEKPKTACLFFDRLWEPTQGHVPEEVRFATEGPCEVLALFTRMMGHLLSCAEAGTEPDKDLCELASFLMPEGDPKAVRLVSLWVAKYASNFGEISKGNVLRCFSGLLHSKQGVAATPVYGSGEDWEVDFPGESDKSEASQSEVVVAVISELSGLT